MRALIYLICIVFTGFLKLLTAQSILPPHQNQNQTSTTPQGENRTDPLLRLCLDSLPDGAALLNSDANEEILILFKLGGFWLQPASNIQSFVQNSDLNNFFRLYRSDNLLKISGVWQEFPANPDHIVSFSGLEPEHPFYNNVLIFKQDTLFRYKVNSLQYSSTSSNIKVELLSSTWINLWFEMPKHDELQTITILRGSRTLILQQSSYYGLSHKFTMYVLNEANLENPVHYVADYHELPNVPSADKSSLKFFYQLSSNQTLYFKSSGKVCSGSGCRFIGDALECDANIQAFMNSFTYWLWKETDLTLRLIMISLSVIGIVNLVLGLSFVRNELRKVAELT